MKKTKQNPRYLKNSRKNPRQSDKKPRTQDWIEKPKILGENPRGGNAALDRNLFLAYHITLYIGPYSSIGPLGSMPTNIIVRIRLFIYSINGYRLKGVQKATYFFTCCERLTIMPERPTEQLAPTDM